MKFLVECLNTYNNCLSRVTIKLLAVTVHLQKFVTAQNNLVHAQWNNGAAEGGGACECNCPPHLGLVHRRYGKRYMH